MLIAIIAFSALIVGIGFWLDWRKKHQKGIEPIK
jgi:hypothetical protein